MARGGERGEVDGGDTAEGGGGGVLRWWFTVKGRIGNGNFCALHFY